MCEKKQVRVLVERVDEREYRGAVLSGRVEKALVWLKARVDEESEVHV